MPASPYTRRHDSGRNWIKKKYRKQLGYKKAGRPRKTRKQKHMEYAEEIGVKIAEQMANGASMSHICRTFDWAPNNPSVVREWYKKYEGLRHLLNQAYIDRADYYVEKIIDIMTKVEKGEMKPGVGRLLIDEYKWIACKLHPKYIESKLGGLSLEGGDGGIHFNIVLAPQTNTKQIENVVEGALMDIESEWEGDI